MFGPSALSARKIGKPRSGQPPSQAPSQPFAEGSAMRGAGRYVSQAKVAFDKAEKDVVDAQASARGVVELRTPAGFLLGRAKPKVPRLGLRCLKQSHRSLESNICLSAYFLFASRRNRGSDWGNWHWAKNPCLTLSRRIFPGHRAKSVASQANTAKSVSKSARASPCSAQLRMPLCSLVLSFSTAGPGSYSTAGTRENPKQLRLIGISDEWCSVGNEGMNLGIPFKETTSWMV